MSPGVLEATADGPVLLRAGALTVLMLHIAGGMVAVVAGYAALAARKGARPHRIAGNVFFAAMLVMGSLAAVLGMPFGGLFTCYLVVTSWLAVRRPAGAVGRAERAAFLFVSALAAVALGGSVLRAAGAPLPAGGLGGAGLVFTAVAALAAALDLKVIRAGGVSGFERLRRHLWRMCAAMFIATGSFFLGQADEIPRSLHGPHLWVLGLAPLAALVWWMIRTRPRPARVVPAPA